MASSTVSQDSRPSGERLDCFLSEVGATVERLRFLGGLEPFPPDWADLLFLVADELDRHCQGISSTIVELRDSHGIASQ